MTHVIWKRLSCWLGLTLMMGCSTEPSAPTGKATAIAKEAAELKGFLLSAEPTGALSVVAARRDIRDGDEIVLVGRIGGSEVPWVEGRAAFTIVDESLKPCNEKADDACKTPWDYCCDLDVLPQSTATVKFVDAGGKLLSPDARTLFGLNELQTVVVRGKAKRDAEGNLTVLASGLYARR